MPLPFGRGYLIAPDGPSLLALLYSTSAGYPRVAVFLPGTRDDGLDGYLLFRTLSVLVVLLAPNPAPVAYVGS